MTALTLYGSNVASTTLTTAGNLSTATGGTNAAPSTLLGTGTNWGEITYKSVTATWPSSGSIGTSTGKGWLLDSTLLEGLSLLAGTYTFTLNAKLDASTTATGTFTVRLYKRSSGGVYTSILSATSSSQTLTTSAASISFTASLASAMSFATGDKLYVDVWFDVTVASSNSSVDIIFNTSTSATQGVAGHLEIDTAGYGTPGGTTHVFFTDGLCGLFS